MGAASKSRGSRMSRVSRTSKSRRDRSSHVSNSRASKGGGVGSVASTDIKTYRELANPQHVRDFPKSKSEIQESDSESDIEIDDIDEGPGPQFFVDINHDRVNNNNNSSNINNNNNAIIEEIISEGDEEEGGETDVDDDESGQGGGESEDGSSDEGDEQEFDRVLRHEKSNKNDDMDMNSMKNFLHKIRDPHLEKQAALLEMEKLKINGATFTKNYTMNDSLADIQFEIRRMEMYQKEESSLNMMRDGLKLTINSIEVINRFTGEKLSLNGWSDEATRDMDRYDPSLSRLYRKYWRRGSSSPEFELAFAIASSMGIYHFKNKFFEKITSSGGGGGGGNNNNHNNNTNNSSKQSTSGGFGGFDISSMFSNLMQQPSSLPKKTENKKNIFTEMTADKPNSRNAFEMPDFNDDPILSDTDNKDDDQKKSDSTVLPFINV